MARNKPGTAPVKLLARPNRLNGMSGKALVPSASTQSEFQKQLRVLVEDMTVEVSHELRKLFSGQAADILDEPVSVEDASIADLAGKLLKKLSSKFDAIFDEKAKSLSDSMVNRTLDNSKSSLSISLKEFAQGKTLNTGILTDRLKVTVTASIAESVGLIKRIPEKYLSDVQNDVMRSITTGNGLQDLIPALEKQGVKTRNWANNVALDQTRKVYGNINRDRMQALNVQKFEWVHSGGSNNPRELHINRWPAGLNGGVFSFDDLPVIDERTGERGIPGQAINCGCTMRPVITFDTGENNE